MDNERKTGAGRAIEEASEDIDRRHADEDTIPGAGPEHARHIAQDAPGASPNGEEDDEDEDEEDEDLEDDTEDEDDDTGRGTPGYGDRGTTPV